MVTLEAIGHHHLCSCDMAITRELLMDRVFEAMLESQQLR